MKLSSELDMLYVQSKISREEYFEYKKESVCDGNKNGLKVCEQCRYCKLENEDKRDYRTSDRYKCNNPRRLNGFEVDPVTGEISTDELYVVNLVNYQREVAYKEPCYHTNEDGTRLICGKSGNWFEELK
jgi:hypothetical protein